MTLKIKLNANNGIDDALTRAEEEGEDAKLLESILDRWIEDGALTLSLDADEKTLRVQPKG